MIHNIGYPVVAPPSPHILLQDKSEEVLDSLLAIFDRLGKPVYHMLGNHCLYNLPRKHLNQK
jgi:hypothetical protein